MRNLPTSDNNVVVVCGVQVSTEVALDNWITSLSQSHLDFLMPNTVFILLNVECWTLVAVDSIYLHGNKFLQGQIFSQITVTNCKYKKVMTDVYSISSSSPTDQCLAISSWPTLNLIRSDAAFTSF
jgi:hypothetical protein